MTDHRVRTTVDRSVTERLDPARYRPAAAALITVGVFQIFAASALDARLPIEGADVLWHFVGLPSLILGGALLVLVAIRPTTLLVKHAGMLFTLGGMLIRVIVLVWTGVRIDVVASYGWIAAGMWVVWIEVVPAVTLRGEPRRS